MRRVTVVYRNGSEVIWKCDSASWGHDSRNAILRGASRYGMGGKSELVLLVLAEIQEVREDEW